MAKESSDSSYDVLLNTKKDSIVLMIFWYIHKSFWALLLIGLLIALIFGQTRDDLLDFRNTKNMMSADLSPLFWLLIALMGKLIADHLFILTAYPLLKRRDLRVSRRASNALFRFFDHWRDMRGISTLRWTHAVRQQAMQQFETEFFRSDKINRSIDFVTCLSLAACFVLMII